MRSSITRPRSLGYPFRHLLDIPRDMYPFSVFGSGPVQVPNPCLPVGSAGSSPDIYVGHLGPGGRNLRHGNSVQDANISLFLYNNINLLKIFLPGNSNLCFIAFHEAEAHIRHIYTYMTDYQRRHIYLSLHSAGFKL